MKCYGFKWLGFWVSVFVGRLWCCLTILLFPLPSRNIYDAEKVRWDLMREHYVNNPPRLDFFEDDCPW